MSGPEEARFTILVKPESPRPAPEIGRVLAAVLDLHITDATVRARYCGGIIASGLERLDPAEFLYFKREEGQNFERWMQLWIRIRELPGEALGPSSSV